MIRAVLFDLDDTLFDHDHCARLALAAVRESHDCFGHIPSEILEASHSRILEELHVDVMSGALELEVARTERFRRLFETAGLNARPEVAAAAAAAYRRRYLESWREVAGAGALLREVRRRARVGVVSNNLLQEQQEKLRHCGLDRYVDVLVVSEEAGVSKPDPHIFEIALQKLDRRADEAVMVGDSWDADIAGARAAGIRAVWFNRRLPAGAGSLPDVPQIDSLEPTDDVLARIFEGATKVRETARRR